MASDRLAAVLTVVLGLAATAPAFAEPSAADRETARTLMKQGDEKAAARDFGGALKAYQAAHAIMQVPTTGLAVAKAQIELGHLLDAHESLLQVARLPKEPNESAKLAAAREEAAQLAQKLVDRIPAMIITVDGPTEGVEVRVDGALVPPAALGAPRKGDPGTHVVTAAANGFATATASIFLREGSTEKVALKMVPGLSTPVPAPPAAIEGGGKIHIVSPSEPGNVFVDGKAVGATPLDVPATVGSHDVEVQYPGGSHDKRTVTVEKGATADLTFAPSAMDALGRYRKGVHFGVAGGPAMGVFLDGGAAAFGGTGSFVFNFGITPMLDLRTGVTATFVNDFIAPAWELSVSVPVLLKVNYTPWFSAAAGLSVGFVELFGLGYDNDTPFNSYSSGYSVGPEWSPFIMSAGDHRQFELSIAQGLRFGNLRKDFHQAVVFTYLFLD